MGAQESSEAGIPAEEFVRQAKRIVEEGEKRGIHIRIMGALAIFIHSPGFEDLHRRLKRLGGDQIFTDIDLMSYSKHRKAVRKMMEDMGYTPDRALLFTGQWGKRHIYHEPKNRFHVDVFFDKLDMCHVIDFRGRLEVDSPTIPLADILLEKMQIVQINEKDLKDCIVLLRAHSIGETDEDVINVKRIADILSDDWGFYYTATTNLNKLKDYTLALKELTEEEKKDVVTKIEQILDYVEKTPKSAKWQMRAKIGTKKKWYKDVYDLFQ